MRVLFTFEIFQHVMTLFQDVPERPDFGVSSDQK